MSLPIDADAAALGKVLTSLPVFVLLIDRAGTIRYINRVEPGFDAREVVGSPAESYLVPGSTEVFEAALRSVFDTGEPTEYDAELPMPDGSAAWYTSRILPYRDGTTVTRVVLVATNVTELKAAQETVANLRQLLPICAWCDRIQDSEGSWQTIEAYLGRKLDTQVTHGMCPACYQREIKAVEG